MARLARLRHTPELDAPVLVCALDGWIDAGGAAATAMSVLIDATGAEVIATFDDDRLIDFRARRPVMHLVNGVIGGLSWSTIELRAGNDSAGNDVLLLAGAEPDFSWHAFVDEVIALAEEFGVQRIVTLGAYPAPVPHTRPVQLALTSSSAPLAASVSGYVRGSLDVPGGVQAALDAAANTAGIPALGLWAQVPGYGVGGGYPAAASALLAGLSDVAGVVVPVGVLDGDILATARRYDELVRTKPEYRDLLAQFEEVFDATIDAGGPLSSGSPDAMVDLDGLPSGDEIAAELQRFLDRGDPD